ncbi:ABC transporter substrate-binding protein [Thermomonospora cellulosilytica]|uniref:ABC-type branched-subunit amino acid transport system substrate-binding protein n=1 Tax=Thermomonospora cellulosilytica TaxID=1411118 RepID=A0A7W3MTT0_9ACTN|nr:ABC transporter substrate-binding protein [Thermomonospora cellulosilytica]MBA9001751.1 ABC-type branched-subunit amino acid transport system substrate-binding protein [Thermomonospora cellulosilytica]
MKRRGHGIVGGLVALVLGLTACGGGADPDAAPGGPGVTREPCPNAVNPDNGCIYLGIISDLSAGPFHELGKPITHAQKAFWRRVNQQGGIGGYDIDVTTHTRDSKYDPATHKAMYEQMKDKVLALAQTLGSPTTAAILPDLRKNKIVATPVSWTSAWEFEDVILESGANYCVEAMNSVDYAVEAFSAESVMAVHFPGDYGDDAAAGAKIAAERRGLDFAHRVTGRGRQAQAPVIDAIVKEAPDVVLLTTGPEEAAAIVGETVRRGYPGHFIGSNPTWQRKMLDGPAGPALRQRYLQSAPWKPFAVDSPGHAAMRLAVGDVTPSDAMTSGWVLSYPLKAVLQKAAANGDLTREGVFRALKQITTIDYEGILPATAGDFSGDPNANAFRQTVLGRPDPGAYTGITVVKEFSAGPTASSYVFTAPCYQTL